MCGICGRTDDPAATAVAAMNAAMVHRGPDDQGIHTDPEAGVSIGARRLSVIDVEHGHQPLANEDGTIWAALNGEIYNHPALKAMLRERGHRLATGTDTEVLVHLYEEYGADLVHALEGMFAFAIWDSRDGSLLVARDRFGEKPLFYSFGGGQLAFASELTVLAAGAELGGDLDPAAVDEYFVYGYLSGQRSILAGARQLPPGHLMRWSAGGEPELRRYWHPPSPSGAGQESTEDLVGELRRLLGASVRSRLIADVPLGVFLSGGVDSTLIAALAARESSGAIKTFTVGYDVGEVSETDAARATARELGSEHHELILPQEEVARRVPAVLSAMDQPLADQSLPAFHAIAEFAREDVTVAVGGEGADELFGGYPRYRWLARAERVGGIVPRPLAALGSRALAGALPAGRAHRLSDVLAPREAMERQLDWIAGPRTALRGSLYGPRLDGARSRGQLVAELERACEAAADGTVAGRFMLLDQVHWLPGDVLTKADRASMQVSLEVRTPYLNHELAEFAATVSPDLHTSGKGKMLLRLLLAELLPDSSRRRPKTAFRVPAAEWLRGPLAPLLRDQVDGGCTYEEGWIDRTAASTLLEEHLRGDADRSEALWSLLAFGLWLDRLRGRDGVC